MLCYFCIIGSLYIFRTLRIINSHVISMQKVAYINSYIHFMLLDYNLNISTFQVTQKDTGRSLKMV
jgi:hypothetical protein